MAKKPKYKTVQGFFDILPKEGPWWKSAFSVGEDVADLYNFHFIETPVLEQAKLFIKSLENETGESPKDNLVVLKSNKPGLDKVALRAEGGTPVLRSYLENHLGYFSSPLRVYYRGPMFFGGAEKDVYQSYHWGFEIVGDNDPFYDAEMILVLHNFLTNLGATNPIFRLNIVGCRVCRPNFFKKINKFFKNNKNKLCEDCDADYKKSPLKALRCINEKCMVLKGDAPIILDCLCQSCNNHFQSVLEFVEDNEINYIPDPHFVDVPGCYSKVVFGVYLSNESDEMVGYGGRQDYLSERIGGRQLPAVGGVLDLSKVIKGLKDKKLDPKTKSWRELFFVAVGKRAKRASLPLINNLRQTRIVVKESVGKRSLSAQLKMAEKSGTEIALILGQKEIYDKSIIIRNLKTNTQETVPQEKMLEEVRDKL